MELYLEPDDLEFTEKCKTFIGDDFKSLIPLENIKSGLEQTMQYLADNRGNLSLEDQERLTADIKETEALIQKATDFRSKYGEYRSTDSKHESPTRASSLIVDNRVGDIFVTETQLGGQLYSIENATNVSGADISDKTNSVKTAAQRICLRLGIYCFC